MFLGQIYATHLCILLKEDRYTNVSLLVYLSQNQDMKPI